MLGGLGQHVLEVRAIAALRCLDQQHIGKAARKNAVQSLGAAFEFLCQRQPVAARDGHADAARIVSADLEARRIDQAVELVFFARDHDAILGDALDALAGRVDQVNILPVEGLQILIVEARPLAELVVPGFQRIRRRLVLDDFVHARAYPLHLLIVGELDQRLRVLDLFARALLAAREQQDVADQICPAIADHVLVEFLAGDDGREIVGARLLPPRSEGSRPFGVGRSVIAHVDGGRRALEDEQLLRTRAEMRHALHGGCACADDADDFVGKPRHAASGIAARIGIVPAARMEAVALECLHAGNTRQLGPMQQAAGDHDETCAKSVAAIGRHDPARRSFVPARVLRFRLEQRLLVEFVMAADAARMLEQFRRLRVFRRRQVAGLLEQRHVDIALGIAGRARITVPVPGAAEISALLDDQKIVDAFFTQARAGQQTRKSAAEADEIDVPLDRVAREIRRRERVFEIAGVVA